LADGIAVQVEEFDGDGMVYERDGLRVIVFEVDHGAVIKPAYGYRIEYGGRAVVISGDTRSNENVVKYGADADLLIHEVAIVRPELASEPYIRRIMGHHTTAREAGTIFERAKPRLAVFTHLVFLASEQISPASVDDLISETRQTYSGPLEIGVAKLLSPVPVRWFRIKSLAHERRGEELTLERDNGQEDQRRDDSLPEH
jgi:ribonuclease Z